MEPQRRVPERAWPGTSALELEDLLDELRSRASAARDSQEQLAALLDAVVAISADLELSEVLGRIVQSACALVDARYGALGVLGPGGERLVEFVTRGVPDEVRAAIGDPPRGHGILGLLIKEPVPRRLKDISAHEQSYGFPPNHPPMKSFLGTPVLIRDEVFGNLYMAEKQGAEEFTEDDETMLVALAAAAGVAIDNARLYATLQGSMKWSTAVGDLTQTLLESADEDIALDLMSSQARDLSGALCAMVALYDDADSLMVRAASCLRPGPWDARGHVLSGPPWTVIREARQPLLLIADTTERSTTSVGQAVRDLLGETSLGPVAVLPLALGQRRVGVLVLGWRVGEDDAAADVMGPLGEFSLQAGLALTASRSQRDRSRMALLEDRDRIARDMHDHVIQRLFATGLSLQAAGRVATNPTVRERLDDAVEALDEAIKDIRHAIFELHRTVPVGPARHAVEELATTYADTLGFDPAIEVTGSLAALPSVVQADVLAVVREGLSNMARHARASSGSVRVVVDDTVLVQVIDDGIGVDANSARSGLVNLRDRAARRDGAFTLERGDSGGTVLTWEVPRPPSAD